MYIGRVEPNNPDSLGAVAGFNGETDDEYLELPGSGTYRVKELSLTSNVGDPGVWMYRVDLSQIICKSHFMIESGLENLVRGGGEIGFQKKLGGGVDAFSNFSAQ